MTQAAPLRVVVYTDAAGIGGAEISLAHLVKAVSDQTHVTVVGVSQTVVEAIAHSHPNVAQMVLPGEGIQAFLAHLQTFYRLSPQIIHFNLCTPWACAIGLTAAMFLPNVRIVRVDQLPLRTTDAVTLWRTRTLCLRVDAHVAVGRESARRMEDFYALGRGSVLSIPNGVPDCSEPPFPPNPSDASMVVGSIGRLDAMKAHDVLIRAIAQVEGVEAYILGDGALRTELASLAKDLKVGDRVHFLGWIEDPRSYLAKFDAVAMPSRSEGFPLAMVEAMLAARPVIATRVGSMPEAILDHQTGILIDKDNVADLVAALRQLRDDPMLRSHLGKQARELAAAHFTVDCMAISYQQLWQQLLASPTVPRVRVPRPKD